MNRFKKGSLVANLAGELAMTYDFNNTTPISRKEYEKIRGAAFAEYEKICDAAWAEYEKIRIAALEDHYKICNPIRAEFEKICDAALARVK
jgi:hypothetical protein